MVNDKNQQHETLKDRGNAPMKSPADCSSIEDVRAAIDAIDHEVVKALGLRSQYVKAITRFKKTKADVQAPARQAIVISQRRAWAAEEGIDPDVVERIYRLLIDHFVAEELKELRLAERDPS
jgi:isochorismate pyruvate lyase